MTRHFPADEYEITDETQRVLRMLNRAPGDFTIASTANKLIEQARGAAENLYSRPVDIRRAYDREIDKLIRQMMSR